LFKRVKFPQTLDQDLLNKIAIIANYLARGNEYEVISSSARIKDQTLRFLVKKGDESFCAILPCFQEEEDINYEIIEE